MKTAMFCISIGCFMLGIGSTMIVLGLTRCAPEDFEEKIKLINVRHEREMFDLKTKIEKKFMIKMVEHGEAEWTVSDDGRTTWTEKALSIEKSR
jgi:hypothetical protein